MKITLKRRRLSSSQIILLGFLGVIASGTILLMLPWARAGAGSAPFLDALFTATSATCVTGLITNDTATYWSVFGQTVILCLIQVGGLGVITVAIFITKLSGRKIGLMQRSTMQEAIAAPQMGGIVRMTGFILKMVVVIEALGAAALLPAMIPEFGIVRGIWYAVFHSISSFCNAGFDLMGVKEPYSSLTSYTGDVAVNVIVMVLIVVGGIGFLTWDDVKRNRFHLRRYRMQSKVVLTVTAVLIVLPAVFFYWKEFGMPGWEDMSVGERILASFFQSVTTRTAGYNTVDLTQLTQSGQMIMILLMLIGGSPGSTAGGMKVTTLAVLFATAVAVFRRRPNAHIFGRRIPNDTAHYAATVLILYLSLFLAGGIFIGCAENMPIVPALFEAASAIATVGVTLGITPDLCAASKVVLIILMFLGRVGGMTIVYAALSTKHPYVSEFPQEKIMVG
ncbi:MAG: Trk family potassium uptake protein [Lachnospiraceae bacterium]|nr:Trk family potassium uptake protein [Lachnospiraceae bacterium]MCI9012786.1 Trk family potassium uptake protein [Lachnospiraceae bacterium]MCI9254459.1 Trk family potassium uptake protein [Lachnospiraceae bacterium]